MLAGFTSKIDEKFRVSFALDLLVGHTPEKSIAGEPNSTHYIGPGSDGQIVIISAELYGEWEKKLKDAGIRFGSLAHGKLMRLARAHAGLVPFTVSIEVKRIRFTVPRDIRVMGFQVESGDDLAALVSGDIFEVFPVKDFKSTQGAYWRVVSMGLTELLAMQKDD